MFMPSRTPLVMLGSIFGGLTSIKSVAGEQWITVTGNTLALTTFDDGFSFILGIIFFGISTIAMYYAVDAYLTGLRNKKAQGELPTEL